MIGVVVISHGPMAHATVESAKFFMGEIEQITSLELKMEDNPEDFGASIKEACSSVDTGDGVIIVADLFGGTPCNQTTYLLSENTHVVAGLSLAMLLELLSSRLCGNVNIEQIVETAKTGIVYINKFYQETQGDDDFDE